MPITSNAKKAHRASLTKRTINDRRRNRMKELIKKVEKEVKTDKALAKKTAPIAYKAIDKAAKSGIIKKNNASRKKSRLSRITK